MSAPTQTALLLGSTGQVGQYVLKELLSSPHFTRVGEYGRRVTSLDSITTGKEKLEQKTIDFEKVDQAGLKESKWDVVFITSVLNNSLPPLLSLLTIESPVLVRRRRLQEVQMHLRRLIESMSASSFLSPAVSQF